MNKLGTVLTLGIILLCVGMKFNSVAINPGNLSAAEVALLNDQIKQIDVEILKKKQELESVSHLEEFALVKELNALGKKKAELKERLYLPPSMQQTLLQTISESIPAGKCLSQRFKKLINTIQESNKNNVIVFPTQNLILYSIGWSPDGSKLITFSLIKTYSLHEGVSYDKNIAKIWNSDGTQLGPDLSIIYPRTFQTFNKNSYIQSSFFASDTLWSWSPDGNKIAFMSTDTTVKIWDVLQKWERNLPHDSYITSMEWSPDGTKLAVGNEKDAKIWDIAKGTGITLNTDILPPIWSVTWSPDSSKLATGSGENIGEIKIWNATTGIEITNLLLNELVYSIEWSPDGNKIAAAEAGRFASVLIWKLSTGEVLHLVHKDQCLDLDKVTWSPDGSKLATILDFHDTRVVKIWDSSTGKQIGPELRARRESRNLSWSPDWSKLLATSNDIRVWNVATGANVWQNLLPDPKNASRQAAWSPDGTKLATTSDVDGVKIWDVATKTQIVSNPNLRDNFLMAWSPNSRKLFLSNAYNVPMIWDLESFLHLRDFSAHPNIDQCDLLQALDMMAARAELGKPLTPIQVTEEQWYTFTTFPKPLRDALRIYIQEPTRTNPPMLEESKRKEMEERIGKALEQMREREAQQK